MNKFLGYLSIAGIVLFPTSLIFENIVSVFILVQGNLVQGN